MKTSENDELTDAQVDSLVVRLMERHGEAIATAVSNIITERVQIEAGKTAIRALRYVAGAALVIAVAAMTQMKEPLLKVIKLIFVE